MQQLSIFEFVSEYWTGQEVFIWFDGWKNARVIEVVQDKVWVEFVDGVDIHRALYRDWQLRNLREMYQKQAG